MAKIIRGTVDSKNRMILKQPEGGVGRLRCPRCPGLAIPQVSTQGQIYVCGSCGAVITSKPL